MLHWGGVWHRSGLGRNVASSDDELKHALTGLSQGPGRAVLIVEPSPDRQARLARLMAVHGHRAIGTSSLDGARAFLRAFPVDLVLLAEEIAGSSPLTVVADLVGRRPHARVVIMSRQSAPEVELEAPRLGALEYVPHSFGGDVLQSLLGG